jgi:hypothetical protein
MKNVHSSIWPIIMIFALLIASLILLHRDKNKYLDQIIEQSIIVDKTLMPLYEQVKAAACSKDYELCAETLHRLNYSQAIALLQFLMEDDLAYLSYNEKVEVVLATALLYENSDEQRGFFNCIQPEKCKTPYSFLTIVALSRDHLLPQVLTWLQQSFDTKTIQLLCRQAYENVVAINNPHLCNLLIQYHVELSKEWASELLYQVVVHDKHQQFIPLLVNAGANMHINYVGKTLLMYALERGNKKMIHALLAGGAEEPITSIHEQKNRIAQAAERLKDLISRKWHVV